MGKNKKQKYDPNVIKIIPSPKETPLLEEEFELLGNVEPEIPELKVEVKLVGYHPVTGEEVWK